LELITSTVIFKRVYLTNTQSVVGKLSFLRLQGQEDTLEDLSIIVGPLTGVVLLDSARLFVLPKLYVKSRRNSLNLNHFISHRATQYHQNDCWKIFRIRTSIDVFRCLFRLLNVYYTLDRTPFDEGSSCRKGLYLHRTTQHINTRQTSMPSARFEPSIPATKRPQTYALGRAATGIGWKIIYRNVFRYTFNFEFDVCIWKTSQH
jgi:hypothetical protein